MKIFIYRNLIPGASHTLYFVTKEVKRESAEQIRKYTEVPITLGSLFIMNNTKLVDNKQTGTGK
jgi:hypothetical protein